MEDNGMALPPPQGNNMYFLIWDGPALTSCEYIFQFCTC